MEMWVLMIWLCNYTAQGRCDPMPTLWNFATEVDCQRAGVAFARSNPQYSVAVNCVGGSPGTATPAQPSYPGVPMDNKFLNEPGLPKFSNDPPRMPRPLF